MENTPTISHRTNHHIRATVRSIAAFVFFFMGVTHSRGNMDIPAEEKTSRILPMIRALSTVVLCFSCMAWLVFDCRTALLARALRALCVMSQRVRHPECRVQRLNASIDRISLPVPLPPRSSMPTLPLSIDCPLQFASRFGPTR